MEQRLMVRNSDPGTSREAASNVDRNEQMCAWVLRRLKEVGSRGLTCPEAAAEYGCPRDSMSPRFGELKSRGEIVENGATRSFDNGRKCVVCVLPDDPTALKKDFKEPVVSVPVEEDIRFEVIAPGKFGMTCRMQEKLDAMVAYYVNLCGIKKSDVQVRKVRIVTARWCKGSMSRSDREGSTFKS